MAYDRWIDPEIAAILDAMPPAVGELSDEALPGLRGDRAKNLALMVLGDEVERTDHMIPGPQGAPDVLVRVHRPKGLDGPLPCLYSIHGGGYVFGTAQTEDPRLERICLDVGCMAASVTYRLSPDVSYPHSLEDCYAGLVWLHEHAGELGVDATRIGIGGTSAGGGLAAALALLARDRGGPAISFQLLIYPMIDDRAANKSSKWNVPVWNPRHNEYGWRSYLGSLFGQADIPGHAAASRATDLTGLPPAYLYVGSADLFMDEDVNYAMALTHAGVQTELKVYPGAVHGFEGIAAAAPVSKRARDEATEWLKRVMASQ